jgi:hypothetical protein
MAGRSVAKATTGDTLGCKSEEMDSTKFQVATRRQASRASRIATLCAQQPADCAALWRRVRRRLVSGALRAGSIFRCLAFGASEMGAGTSSAEHRCGPPFPRLQRNSGPPVGPLLAKHEKTPKNQCFPGFQVAAEGFEPSSVFAGFNATDSHGGTAGGTQSLDSVMHGEIEETPRNIEQSTQLLSLFCRLSESHRSKLLAFAEQLIEQRTPD